MKLELAARDLSVLKGRAEADALSARDGELVLTAPLPRGWERAETAVLRLRVEAEHQAEVLLGLCATEDGEPRLTMHYRVLPRCRVEVPFPLDARTLSADYAFLPPWPGVFKGGVDGLPTLPGDARFLRLTLRERTLRRVELEGVSFENGWQPRDVRGEPLLDELGQCKAASWSGKTENAEALQRYLQGELAWAKTHDRYPDGWSRYGGWLRKRFDTTGWFHTAHDGRRWWLVDPEGYAFFSNGMCYGNRTGIYGMADHLSALHDWLPEREGLFAGAWTTGDQIPQYVVRNGLENARTRRLVNFPRANMMRAFGDKWLEAWIDINAARMRAWGINTLGVGVNDYGDEPTATFLARAGMPYVITFKYFPLTEERIFRDFPDVFSDEYTRLAGAMARRELAAYRDDPLMIGYFVTNEPEWLMHKDVNLAQCLLAAEGCRASKERLAAFLRERYATADALNEAWQTSFADFDALLAPLRLEPRTRAARADLDAFHLMMVDEYGRVVSDALRAVDSHHLNLGMRYSRASEKTLCGAPRYFDVFSFNRYGAEPASAAALIAKGADMPMLVGEWHVGAKDSGLDAWGLYYADTQAERARAIAYYLEQSTQEPHLTGTHYFEYGDQPYLGRFDGECYNIGLIDVCNRPYPLVAEAFRAFAQRMYPLLDGQLAPAARETALHNIWQKEN